LPDAIIDLPIGRELASVHRKLRRTDDVKPVRIVGFEVVSGIEHDESVKVDPALEVLLLR
jgi:hypothetical protein